MAKRNSKSNSSMPTDPVLRGRRWTGQLRDRVIGRWVLVGWIDSPAEPGICIGNQYERAGDPEVFFPAKGYTMPLDSPGQVIDIGPGIKRDCPYSKSGGEWSVEG